MTYTPHGEAMAHLLATYRLPIAHDIGWPYKKSFDGYGLVWVGNRHRHIGVHALVCELVHGPCPEGKQTRHLCPKNRKCYWAEHLVWGTRTENAADKLADGTNRSGVLCGAAKLTEAKVLKIRELHAQGGYTKIKLGEMFDVSDRAIGKIVSRTTWTHI